MNIKRFTTFINGVLMFYIFTITLATNTENNYNILNIENTASAGEIKKAFKKLSLEYHPDKNINNKEEAKRKFIQVANAYEILSDPVKKKEYDEDLQEN